MSSEIAITYLLEQMRKKKIINYETYREIIKMELAGVNKDISYSTKQFKAVENRGNIRRVAALTRVSTQHEQQMNALENQNQWILSKVSRHQDWHFNVEEDLYVDEGGYQEHLRLKE